MKTKKYTALSFVVILLVSALTSCGNVPNIQNASSNHDANFVELDDATKKTTAVIEGLYEEVPFDYSEQYQFFGDIKKANDDKDKVAKENFETQIQNNEELFISDIFLRIN